MLLIGRIFAIMAAALLVVGATFALVNFTPLFSAAGPQREGFAQQRGGERPEGALGEGRPAGRPEGGRGGAGALFEIGKSLGIIAAIVVVVALLSWLARRRRPAAAPDATMH
jgi:hypothetical protein